MFLDCSFVKVSCRRFFLLWTSTSVFRGCNLGEHLVKLRSVPGEEECAFGRSRNAEVKGEGIVLLIPHTVTLPASNRLIAGHIIGRKDCPALYTCVCNYFSNRGDKWHDWFPCAGTTAPGGQEAFLLELCLALWSMNRTAPPSLRKESPAPCSGLTCPLSPPSAHCFTPASSLCYTIPSLFLTRYLYLLLPLPPFAHTFCRSLVMHHLLREAFHEHSYLKYLSLTP